MGYNYQEVALRRGSPEDIRKRFIFGSENGHQFSNWTIVRDNDYVAGQFLWTGIDYLGEAHAWPNRGNGAGLLDLCGFKKPNAWFRQSLWSDRPMVYVCAAPAGAGARPRGARVEDHWNWDGNATIAISSYTNCSEVQLTLNGRALGTRRLAEAAEGVLSWDVPYEPGTLKAVGIRDGRPASEFILKTAGQPDHIELQSDAAGLRTGGKNIFHVEFRIVDARGVRVPNADMAITFEIAGPAEILGIGNGDLNDTTDGKDHVHKAYQGRGLAILQSTTAGAGGIVIKATSPGLGTALLTLPSR